MKNITRIFSLLLVLVMAFSCLPAAFAAEADETVIQEDHPCSLTIFKYDFTNAKKDGVWKEDSFISTGWHESYVEDVLGNAIRKRSSAGNSENAPGNGTASFLRYASKAIPHSIQSAEKAGSKRMAVLPV